MNQEFLERIKAKGKAIIAINEAQDKVLKETGQKVHAKDILDKVIKEEIQISPTQKSVEAFLEGADEFHSEIDQNRPITKNKIVEAIQQVPKDIPDPQELIITEEGLKKFEGNPKIAEMMRKKMVESKSKPIEQKINETVVKSKTHQVKEVVREQKEHKQEITQTPNVSISLDEIIKKTVQETMNSMTLNIDGTIEKGKIKLMLGNKIFTLKIESVKEVNSNK